MNASQSSIVVPPPPCARGFWFAVMLLTAPWFMPVSVWAQKTGSINRSTPSAAPAKPAEQPATAPKAKADAKSSDAKKTETKQPEAKERVPFITFGKKDSKKKEDVQKAPETPAGPPPKPAIPEGVTFEIKATPELANDPLRKVWLDQEFQKRVIGSYGFLSELEPKFNGTNEMAIYREVAKLIPEDPKTAAYVLSTNATPEATAIFDYTLGTLYFQQGDFKTAAKHFQTAVTKFPDYRRAHKNLAFCHLKSGSYVEAVTPLTRAVDLGDRDNNTYGLLGFCYLSQEKFIPAEVAYRNAILYAPDNKDWRMGLIKSLVAQSRLGEADRMIEEMLQAEPENDALWNLQAGIYFQMEQPRKAALNYEILRKLGKGTPKLLMTLGDIYMSQDARELALGAYQEAIEKEGASNLPRAIRAASVLVSRGAWDEAEALFRKIRAAGGAALTGDDELKLLKLESRAALARGAADQAMAVLEKVIQRNPLDAEALLMVGDFHYRAEQFEKAEFRFEMASKISGFEADATVKLAQIRVKQQKWDKAIELLRKAQKIKPRDNVQRYLEAIERMARAANS